MAFQSEMDACRIMPATSLGHFARRASAYFLRSYDLFDPVDKILGANILFNFFCLSRMYEFRTLEDISNPNRTKIISSEEKELNRDYLDFIFGICERMSGPIPNGHANIQRHQLMAFLQQFLNDPENTSFLKNKSDDPRDQNYTVGGVLNELMFMLSRLDMMEGLKTHIPAVEGPCLAPRNLVLMLLDYNEQHGEKLPFQDHVILDASIGVMLDQIMMHHLTEAAKEFDFINPYFECLINKPHQLASSYSAIIKSEGPDHAISSFRTRIRSGVEGLVASDLSNKQKAARTDKLYARLETFNAMLDNMPAGMEQMAYFYTRRDAQAKSAIRKDYQAKKDFISATAIWHAPALWRAGVSLRHIFHMARHGTFPTNGTGPAYDMNIEHIYDVSGGGFNAHFCIMPGTINHLNGRLVELQTFDMKPGDTRLVVCFAPKPGKYGIPSVFTGGSAFTRKAPTPQ